MARVRVAVLISGRGSNMEALLRAAQAPNYPAEIVAVIANNPDAVGLHTAAEAGVATAIVDHRAYSDKPAFEAALHDALAQYDPDLICLAGFMRLLSGAFVSRLGKPHPQHPPLACCPAFKGLDTHQRALDAGVKLAGCTVHVVRAEMDDGPIIAQAAVPVLAEGDDAETPWLGRILVSRNTGSTRMRSP
jgi:phosphoribosylglycinamide formyltransferase-1